MNTIFPIRVRMSKGALEELHSCEYGSYEDHVHADDSREEPYDDGTLHIVEIIERSPYKTVVQLENQAEVDEFFGQALTGTFGLYHVNIALRLYRELLPHVSEKAKASVNPGSIGY